MSITIYRPGTAGEPSLAERMGYKKTDKLLMIHADDIGAEIAKKHPRHGAGHVLAKVNDADVLQCSTVSPADVL